MHHCRFIEHLPDDDIAVHAAVSEIIRERLVGSKNSRICRKLSTGYQTRCHLIFELNEIVLTPLASEPLSIFVRPNTVSHPVLRVGYSIKVKHNEPFYLSIKCLSVVSSCRSDDRF
jgi:hypothetical protein